MKKELTCIVCPMGCNICVETENDKIVKITGNTCKRGENYARSEFTNPVRTVTSTVKCDNGKVLSVKTDRPIAKNKIVDCMKLINDAVADTPVKIGKVIIEDVFGCNIVATENME